MRLRFAALTLAFAFSTTAFAAENNSFVLVSRAGRTIGKASYTVDKTKDGLKVKSRFEYRLGIAEVQPVEGDPTDRTPASSMVTDAQYTFEYKVDANGNFQSGFTQNSADQRLTSFQPSKPRDVLTISQMQGGVNLGSRSLDLPKPDFMVVPDYDPSALQVLLTCALAHPHPDSLYLLVVPGKGGTNSLFIALQPAEDTAGTLDGKPVALKHYLLKYNKGSADVYTSADGTLMEADMGPLRTNYVRAKFALNAPAATK